MAPNLFLLAKKAVSPWKWCSSESNSSPDRPHLYFGREPITGIYAVSSKGNRYLVAIRPKRKPDVDGIFQTTRNNSVGGKRDLAKSHVASNTMTTEYIQSTELYNERAKTIVQVTVTELPRAVSPSSTTSTRSRTSTHKSEIQYSTYTESSYSTCSKNPIVSCDKSVNSKDFVMNNTGVLPHQKSPFGKDCHRYKRQSQSPIRSARTKIGQIDLNGYRFLARPLLVEHNNILGRWMFSSEVKARTMSAPMCKSVTCMETDMRHCGKTVQRELFVLDDGVSWVIGNGKRKTPYRGGEFLFKLDMIDDELGLPRRQTVQEVEESGHMLAERHGNFIVGDDDVDYAALLRYLDMPTMDI
ncbi:hypothetical protein ONS95_000571 [Cadophora gregata]|uniref:uncharacterized protein n=1 Tax=Cadophora gregata TaxID=51156 RepID=UPI0026DBCAFD|nr:uncharacterized protein ONS95_000571 [Cadophora gregata]KAK0128609.1 hypothetical protein ONS95_000571 [Cadophora gregata]